MKYITTTLLLIILLSLQSFLAMEHEYNQLSNTTSSINDYGSLTEYVTIDLEEQKEALINQMDQFAQSNLDDYHPMFTVPLPALSKDFHYMSPEDKHRIIRQLPTNLLMSKKMSLLLQAMMVLPPEIVTTIYRYMLDDEEGAAKLFCELPFAHALEMCQEIRTRRVNDTYTIGSLFVKYCSSRDTLAKTDNKRWYSHTPIVSSKDKEEIDLLDGDIRIAFLQDQKIFVDGADIENNNCIKLQHCCIFALPEPWCTIGMSTAGGLFSAGFILAIIGAIGGLEYPIIPGVFVPTCFFLGVLLANFTRLFDGCDKYRNSIMVIEPHKETEEAI